MPFFTLFHQIPVLQRQMNRVIRIPYIHHGRNKRLSFEYSSIDANVWKVTILDDLIRTEYRSADGEVAWRSLKAAFELDDELNSAHNHLIQFFFKRSFYKNGTLYLGYLNKLCNLIEREDHFYMSVIANHWRLSTEAEVMANLFPIYAGILMLCCSPLLYFSGFTVSLVYIIIWVLLILFIIVIESLPRRGATQAEWENILSVRDRVIQIERDGCVTIDPPTVVAHLPGDDGENNNISPVLASSIDDERIIFGVSARLATDEDSQVPTALASFVFR